MEHLIPDGDLGKAPQEERLGGRGEIYHGK